MSHKIDLTTLTGDTTTVTINTPGKWLVIASTLMQPTGSTSSPGYSIYITWLGITKLVNGSHSGATNFPTDTLTFANIIDVASTYTSTVSASPSTRIANWRATNWVAVKIGPAS